MGHYHVENKWPLILGEAKQVAQYTTVYKKLQNMKKSAIC